MSAIVRHGQAASHLELKTLSSGVYYKNILTIVSDDRK